MMSLGWLKEHSQFWDGADLNTSFLTLKTVHLNLKAKNISASILAAFSWIFNRLLENMFLSVLLCLSYDIIFVIFG